MFRKPTIPPVNNVVMVNEYISAWKALIINGMVNKNERKIELIESAISKEMSEEQKTQLGNLIRLDKSDDLKSFLESQPLFETENGKLLVSQLKEALEERRDVMSVTKRFAAFQEGLDDNEGNPEMLASQFNSFDQAMSARQGLFEAYLAAPNLGPLIKDTEEKIRQVRIEEREAKKPGQFSVQLSKDLASAAITGEEAKVTEVSKRAERIFKMLDKENRAAWSAKRQADQLREQQQVGRIEPPDPEKYKFAVKPDVPPQRQSAKQERDINLLAAQIDKEINKLKDESKKPNYIRPKYKEDRLLILGQTQKYLVSSDQDLEATRERLKQFMKTNDAYGRQKLELRCNAESLLARACELRGDVYIKGEIRSRIQAAVADTNQSKEGAKKSTKK